MDQVVYNGDTRYPAPPVHPPPSEIGGIPTQAELDAFPRMFTWGELKEIVRESNSTGQDGRWGFWGRSTLGNRYIYAESSMVCRIA